MGQIRGDEELDALIKVAIAGGGVIPHIHKSLLKKKCQGLVVFISFEETEQSFSSRLRHESSRAYHPKPAHAGVCIIDVNGCTAAFGRTLAEAERQAWSPELFSVDCD